MARCERSCHEKRRIFDAAGSLRFQRLVRTAAAVGDLGDPARRTIASCRTPRAVTGDGARLTAQIYAETYLSRHFS